MNVKTEKRERKMVWPNLIGPWTVCKCHGSGKVIGLDNSYGYLTVWQQCNRCGNIFRDIYRIEYEGRIEHESL